MKATIEPVVEPEVTLVMTRTEASILKTIVGYLSDTSEEKVCHKVYRALEALDLNDRVGVSVHGSVTNL